MVKMELKCWRVTVDPLRLLAFPSSLIITLLLLCKHALTILLHIIAEPGPGPTTWEETPKEDLEKEHKPNPLDKPHQESSLTRRRRPSPSHASDLLLKDETHLTHFNPLSVRESRRVGKQSTQFWRYFGLTPLFPFLALFSYTHTHLSSLYRGLALEELDLDLDLKPFPLRDQVEISLYRCLPWRTISRVWGAIHAIPLPHWARTPFLTSFAALFSCNLEETQMNDLTDFTNLGEFFRRELKPGVRPIAQAPLTSPVDGCILFLGRVERGRVEQVKGVNYSLSSFMGPLSWENSPPSPSPSPPPQSTSEECEFGARLLKDPQRNCLYSAVIYLAPGDYHRFHSPTNWTIRHRRHFPGELLSVNPYMARWISGLFSLNERALYMGEWSQGFFCMGAVGATNVGSIRVYGDPSLSTNRGQWPWPWPWAASGGRGNRSRFRDQSLSMQLSKGDPFGEFNLGSTVVLLFEASKCLQTQLHHDQPHTPFDPKAPSTSFRRIRMGESLLPLPHPAAQAQGQRQGQKQD